MSGDCEMTPVLPVRNHGFRFALLISLMCFGHNVLATTDNWNVDGEHGELHVTGQLTEGACRLDMSSAHQAIELGNVTTSDFINDGDQGKPVAFQVRLRDCIRTQSSRRDNRTGNLVWSANQPVVSVAFLAPADADSPALIRLEGQDISGVGLRLLDEQHQGVRLGTWNRPHLLTPGQDEMTFYVVPERTSASLVAGDFHATINFHLNYE